MPSLCLCPNCRTDLDHIEGEPRVPGGEIRAEEERLAKDVQREAELPGFRKGKVPASIIHRAYGDRIRLVAHDEAIVKRMEARAGAGVPEKGPERE